MSEFWSQHHSAELACQRIFLEFMTYHYEEGSETGSGRVCGECSERAQVWCIVLP